MDKNNDFDLICYDFQQKIVDIFNKQQNIPFQLKYYLFKQIWKTVKRVKKEKDYEIRMLNSQGQKSYTAEIPIPDDFFQNDKNENKNEE